MVTTSPATGGTPSAADAANPPGIAQRVVSSFRRSAATVVFGMEDGTVSIFGLVFGVSAAASSSRAVLLAGATGTAAAAVSMMAGTYLDAESSDDQGKVALDDERRRLKTDPSGEGAVVATRLASDGFTPGKVDRVMTIVRNLPDTGFKLSTEVRLGTLPTAPRSPVVESAWMLVTDLFAAAVPAVPFAILSLATARLVSMSVTIVLLVLLGIGRAAIGHRPVLRTVLETIAIAAGAGAAGVAIGRLIS
jgi:VIT1/CCC1 family predicted Fe2+/Mn2+ transporter